MISSGRARPKNGDLLSAIDHLALAIFVGDLGSTLLTLFQIT